MPPFGKLGTVFGKPGPSFKKPGSPNQETESPIRKTEPPIGETGLPFRETGDDPFSHFWRIEVKNDNSANMVSLIICPVELTSVVKIFLHCPFNKYVQQVDIIVYNQGIGMDF